MKTDRDACRLVSASCTTGWLDRIQGELWVCPDGRVEAEARYRRALAFAREAGLVGRPTDQTLGIAMARAGSDRYADALRLAAAAHEKQTQIGKAPDAWWRSMQDRLLGAAQEAVTDGDREAAEREGRATGFDRTLDEVLAVQPVR